jgi:hypothetical protein
MCVSPRTPAGKLRDHSFWFYVVIRSHFQSNAEEARYKVLRFYSDSSWALAFPPVFLLHLQHTRHTYSTRVTAFQRRRSANYVLKNALN